jgi:pimeloyl-ACP methyl ester carboxylesterase
MSFSKHHYLIPSFDHQPLSVNHYSNSRHPETSFVILHGLGGDSNNPGFLAQNLIKKCPSSQCVVYDLRGHGLSTHQYPANSTSIEETGAKDLHFICQYFNLTKPVFIGHSLGSVFIQTYITLGLLPQPKSVYLISSPLVLNNYSLNRNFWYRLLIKLALPLKFTLRSSQVHRSFRHSHDLNLFRIFLDIKSMGLTTFLLTYASLFGYTQKHHFSKLNQPFITFIYGHNDIFISKSTTRCYQSLLPRAKFIYLPTNHHQLMIKYPHKLANIIIENILS